MTMFPNNYRGRQILGVLFALTSIGTCSAAERAKTVELKNGAVVERVMFDPSSITQEEITHWMELSPILGRGNSMLFPEGIEFCPTSDPRYHGCSGYSDEWNPNLANAQVTLNTIAARIEKLAPENYPRELTEVAKYVRHLQSFALWTEQHKLGFVKSNDVSVLEEQYGRIDPRVPCESVLKRIRDTRDLLIRSHLARFDWHNCMWSAAQKELGLYPLERWKSFLDAYGIKEEEVKEDIDD